MASFYLDHNVARRVAVLLRVDGFSAITTRELGNERNDDVSQLAVAISHRSVFVTHDDDFRSIHQRWSHRPALLRSFRDHPGIPLIPAFPIWDAVRTVSEIEVILEQMPVLVGLLYEWAHDGWVLW